MTIVMSAGVSLPKALNLLALFPAVVPIEVVKEFDYSKVCLEFK